MFFKRIPKQKRIAQKFLIIIKAYIGISRSWFNVFILSVTVEKFNAWVVACFIFLTSLGLVILLALVLLFQNSLFSVLFLVSSLRFRFILTSVFIVGFIQSVLLALAFSVLMLNFIFSEFSINGLKELFRSVLELCPAVSLEWCAFLFKDNALFLKLWFKILFVFIALALTFFVILSIRQQLFKVYILGVRVNSIIAEWILWGLRLFIFFSFIHVYLNHKLFAKFKLLPCSHRPAWFFYGIIFPRAEFFEVKVIFIISFSCYSISNIKSTTPTRISTAPDNRWPYIMFLSISIITFKTVIPICSIQDLKPNDNKLI